MLFKYIYPPAIEWTQNPQYCGITWTRFQMLILYCFFYCISKNGYILQFYSVNICISKLMYTTLIVLILLYSGIIVIHFYNKRKTKCTCLRSLLPTYPQQALCYFSKIYIQWVSLIYILYTKILWSLIYILYTKILWNTNHALKTNNFCKHVWGVVIFNNTYNLFFNL